MLSKVQLYINFPVVIFPFLCCLSRNIPGKSLISSLLSDPIKLLDVFAMYPGFGLNNSEQVLSFWYPLISLFLLFSL